MKPLVTVRCPVCGEALPVDIAEEVPDEPPWEWPTATKLTLRLSDEAETHLRGHFPPDGDDGEPMPGGGSPHEPQVARRPRGAPDPPPETGRQESPASVTVRAAQPAARRSPPPPQGPPAKGAYGVKQYVAVVRGRHGRFMVFETGDSKFYLFSQLDRNGCATGLTWPVRKADLRDDVRKMLRAGCGNAGLGRE